MWLKKARPEAENIMVEQDSSKLAVGRNNFARNGFVGEFIQAVVSRQAWQLDHFLRERGLHHVDGYEALADRFQRLRGLLS